MEEKSTGDLRRELMEQDSIDTYIKENQTLFTDKSVAELLTELYEQKDLTKAELARRASMSEVYLHQVFSGRRNPSRTAFCAFASAWAPRWRRRRSF